MAKIRRGRRRFGAVGTTQYIDGLSQALANFETIMNTYGEQGQSLVEPLYQGAIMIRDSARANLSNISTWRTPKTWGTKGNLSRGIKAGKFDPGYPEKPAAFTGIDYKIAPHAHNVEYGHVMKLPKGEGAVGHVPPHKFFRPAIDMNRTRIMMMIKKEMQTRIQLAAAAMRAI